MKQIRKFNLKQDIKQICEFHREHVAVNFPDSKYKEKLFKASVRSKYKSNPNELFVFELENRLAGFLWLDIIYDPYKEIKYGYIHYIHVDIKFRGRCVGKTLMQFAEKYFKTKKIREIRLGTNIKNKVSLSFYGNLGFKADRILFKKTLK